MDFKEIDLKEYIKIFYKNRKVFLLVFGSILIFTTIFTLLLPKIYEAKTTILFASVGDVGKLASFAGISIPFGGGGGSSSSSITSSMPIMDPTAAKIASASYIKVILQSKKLRLELAKKLDLYKLYHVKSDEIMAKIVAANTIISIDKDGLLTIAARASSPDLASSMANKYVDVLKEYNNNSKLGTAKKRKTFVENQLILRKKEMEDMDQKMKDFIARYKIFDIKSYTQSIQAYKDFLEKDRNSAAVDVNTLKMSLDNMKTQLISQARLAKSDFTQFNTISDMGLKKIREELISKMKELTLARKGRSDSHPIVVKLKHEIKAVENFYKQQLEKYVKSLNSNFPSEFVDLHVDYYVKAAKLEALNKSIEENNRYLADLPKVILDYMELQREYDNKKIIYAMLEQDLESTKIMEAQEAPDLEVLDIAAAPEHPSYPSVNRNILIGFLFGIIFGVFSAFAWEYVDLNFVKKIKVQ